MIYRDALGNTLSEGDLVVIQPGTVIGQIAKLASGLGAPNTPESVPAIFVAVTIPIQASPNGIVGGAIKPASPQPAAPTISE